MSKMYFRARASAHGAMGRRIDPSWPLSHLFYNKSPEFVLVQTEMWNDSRRFERCPLNAI